MNRHLLFQNAWVWIFLYLTWFPICSNAQESEIYNNGNIASVINNPDSPTVFNLEHPTFVSYVSTYHWNFAKGATPGTIALRSAEGITYGPWNASGRDGQGNVVGANWDTRPNILLPMGVYTVIDSDPSTWSQNNGSGNKGFVTVRGVVLANQIVKSDNQFPITIFDNNNKAAVLNGPTSPTRFEIKEFALITFISTYHWNFGSGATPGILSLKNEQGATFGPWNVTPRAGQNNTPNANWDARPNEILPPGLYTVMDSDPDTWSRNSDSNNQGFANIQGIPLSSGTTSFQKEFELALGLKTTWTLSGESNWFTQSSETKSGETALQSGSIGHGQVSRLQTTLRGPGELSYFWKASSEGADSLILIMDGESVTWISGETDWQEVRIPIRWGEHELAWEYRKDGSVDRGADAVWLDEVNYIPVELIDLEEALIYAPHPIKTSEVSPWFGQKKELYQGQPAAQTGNIDHQQSTRMTMTVEGPGFLSWAWKSSTEPSDRIRLLDGETVLASIGGENDWSTESRSLRWGTHQLSWEYAKDGNVSLYEDAGWVSAISYAQVILSDLPTALNHTKTTWTTDTERPWFGQSAVAIEDGFSAQSGNISHNQATQISTTIPGPAHLIFHWKASTEGADRCTFAINGNNLSSISGETDWQQLVYYLNEGPNDLAWTYQKDGNIDAGFDAVWLDQIQTTPPDHIRLPLVPTVPPDGGIVQLRSAQGQVFLFEITGSTDGSIWGTDIYTDDSNLAKAAVHAGILAPGETGVVKTIILPGMTQYEASQRHGVQSNTYGNWAGSYRLEGYMPATDTVPTLVTQLINGSLILTWNGDPDDWNLFVTPSLTPPVQWKLSDATVEWSNDVNTVHLPTEEKAQFFQLSR